MVYWMRKGAGVDRYAFESRVRYSECDQTGRLSLVSMVNYLQDCSTFQSEELDRGFASLREQSIAWILANWRIELGELPALGEKIVISTWCYEMTRSHALRCFSITNEDGVDVVRADSQWFVFDTKAGHVSRVPDDQRVYLSDRPRADMAPLNRRMRAEGGGSPCAPFLVRSHHLDTNNHMNNAQYVLLAHDALEELGCSQRPGCVSVLYRKMALLGDVVAPVVYQHEGGWDVDLTDGEGATYALVRFDARQEEA